eukprot:Skav210548  [mRNA]  locus=scaffold1646:135051:140933:+ [translate_table: standard]
MLQLRNVKYNMLKKLVDQAGVLQELRVQQSAPETNEERAERKQLDFWDQRIEQRKSLLDTEKGKLRKEFGRNWEQKLERALLEQDHNDVEDAESAGASTESKESKESEPEIEVPPVPDFDLERENQEMEDFIMRKGHVIAKKYSRQMRSTIFRRQQEEAEQNLPEEQHQRRPLAGFPEGREGRGRERKEGEGKGKGRKGKECSSWNDADLGPYRQSHRGGILGTGAEDYMMGHFSDQNPESYLEALS